MDPIEFVARLCETSETRKRTTQPATRAVSPAKKTKVDGLVQHLPQVDRNRFPPSTVRGAWAFVGRTGLGKTYNIYNTLKDRFGADSVLFIRNLEDLKRYEPALHSDIIFDDITHEHRPPEELINLVDTEFPASIRILHKCVNILPSCRRWFTHNCEEAFQPLLAEYEQQEAINRRLTVFLPETREEIAQKVLELIR